MEMFMDGVDLEWSVDTGTGMMSMCADIDSFQEKRMEIMS